MSKSDSGTGTVLVDTDVYSYLGKPSSTNAALYWPHVEQKLIALSFVSVGELYYGAYKNRWSRGRLDDLTDRLRSVAIVPYDVSV